MYGRILHIVLTSKARPMDKTIRKLLTDFKDFVAQCYSPEHKSKITDLIDHGQRPEILVIGCSDSRCGPETLFKTNQGDLFVQRHIAALVASFDQSDICDVTAATIDYAIEALHVKHIIILSHTDCGGIAGLCKGLNAEDGAVGKWISQAKEVLEQVKSENPELTADQLPPLVEHASIKWSLNNLKSYPAVAKALSEDKVALHGWQYDMRQGIIMAYDAEKDDFIALTDQI